MIGIGKYPVQRSFQIMGMYVRALRDIRAGSSDGFSVFDDGGTGRDIRKGELMPGGDILLQKKTGFPVGFACLTGIAFGNPCPG